ncbi:O-antigen ligase family protein [Kineococcus arenarius]|uniref:O-antigen ligase family protein n=1 Tax=Kineococcus sp. SYSU DK007 TaxID=3383128 RepID=UPI003D7C762F
MTIQSADRAGTALGEQPESPAAGPVPPGEPSRPMYLWCLLGVVVFNVFSGHWDAFHLPLGLDRVFFGVGVVLLALDPWAWQRTRLRFRPIHVAMIALLLVAVLSAAAHSTLLNPYGLFALLDRIFVPFLLFCVAPVVFNTPERRDLLLRTLVLLGLYLGVTALLETLHAYSLLFPSYIGDPDVGIQYGRARGPFVASEAMGLACAACAFAGAAAATRFRGWWRALSVLVVLLCLAGVVGCLTRSVWVGTALGAVVAMAGIRRTRRLLPLALVVGALLVMAMLAFVPGLRETAGERAGTTNSVLDRQNTNAAALRIVDAEPLTGVGWVRFIEVSHDWVRQADTYPITNVNIEVHNVVLSRAAELGVPGAAAFVACVLLGPVRALVQRRRPEDAPDLVTWRAVASGVTIGWCVAIMLSPMPYPLPNSLTWMMAGIALIPYLTRAQDRDRTDRPAAR